MKITVFTPTYNRVHLLPRLYESLRKQTFTDFEWVIVDDGSVDDTKSLTQTLSQRWGTFFPMHYFYQENGGKHRAINRGVKEAKGELFFIADSDDWLPENALAIVDEEYAKVSDDKSIGGVAGLDCYDNGKIVGSGLPTNAIDCNAIDIRMKYHVRGDLKEVFRTNVLREIPFPEIDDEKFCPEQLVWFRIAQKYSLHFFNKPIYVAEYQEQGLTAGITRVRMNSPVATMMTYQELNGYAVPFKERVKAAINYWRFRFCYKGKDAPSLSWWWAWVMPVAYIMHVNDKRKVAA